MKLLNDNMKECNYCNCMICGDIVCLNIREWPGLWFFFCGKQFMVAFTIQYRIK